MSILNSSEKVPILTNNKDVNMMILSDLQFEDLREVLTVSKECSKYNTDILWRNYLDNWQDFDTIKKITKSWKEFALLLEKYFVHNSNVPIKYRFIMSYAAEEGQQDIIDFCMLKGATKTEDITLAIYYAAKGGHRKIIDFLIPKTNIHDWDWYMHPALRAGHRHLVDFFISLGAGAWEDHLYSAALGGHLDLVERMIGQGASNWNRGMYGAAAENNLPLVEYFIEKGADNWKIAKTYCHADLLPFFDEKIEMESANEPYLEK